MLNSLRDLVPYIFKLSVFSAVESTNSVESVDTNSGPAHIVGNYYIVYKHSIIDCLSQQTDFTAIAQNMKSPPLSIDNQTMEFIKSKFYQS